MSASSDVLAAMVSGSSGERVWEIREAVKDRNLLAFKDGDSTLVAVIDAGEADHRPDAMVVADRDGIVYAIFIPLGKIVGHPDTHFIARRCAAIPAGTRVRITPNWPLWEGRTGTVTLHDGGHFSVYIKLDDEPGDRLLSFRDDRSLRYHIAASRRSVEVLS